MLANEKIGRNELAVFVLLADHINKEGVAYPSTAYLAFMLKTSDRTIQRTLRLLVEEGFLLDYQQKRKSTAYKLSTRCLNWIEEAKKNYLVSRQN